MILVVTFMIIGIIVGIILTDSWTKILGAFLGWILGIIFGAVIAMVIGGIGHKITPEKITERLNSTTYLEVLQDNGGVHGSFFLGCGSLNDEMYYSYYEQVGVDEFKLNKMKYDIPTTKIIRDNSKPRIEYCEDIWQTNWGIWTNEKMIIYVPDGTINNSFSLDAK
jgi:ABC-type transport system involved in multi-copper enzyme maturation permease subunit